MLVVALVLVILLVVLLLLLLVVLLLVELMALVLLELLMEEVVVVGELVGSRGFMVVAVVGDSCGLYQTSSAVSWNMNVLLNAPTSHVSSNCGYPGIAMLVIVFIGARLHGM